MVVPYNPKKLPDKTLKDSLSHILKKHDHPIEKINQYNQLLAKSNQPNPHPVVPSKSEKDDQNKTLQSENDETGSLNQSIPITDDDDGDENETFDPMDISVQQPLNKPKLKLPPPSSLFQLPKSTRKTIKKSKSRRSRGAPYPSPKNTRAFAAFQSKGYFERPYYDEATNQIERKKRKIIELEKTLWEQYK